MQQGSGMAFPSTGVTSKGNWKNFPCLSSFIYDKGLF